MRIDQLHRLRSRVTALAILCIASATGCGAPPPTPLAPEQAGAPAVPAIVPAQETKPAAAPALGDVPVQRAPGAGAALGAKTQTTSKDEPRVSQALIVYTADVVIGVDPDQIPKTIDSVVDVAESVGGHLAGRSNDTVKVKVPSGRFREGLQKIEKLGLLLSEEIRAEDVTAEFRDAEVRLENLRATRKRLEEFLARASTMADMLTVERELERVAKEMDVLGGRLRFLKEHTAFSLLSVRMTAKARTAPVVVANVPPRTIDLPVAWFSTLGVDELLRMPAAKDGK